MIYMDSVTIFFSYGIIATRYYQATERCGNKKGNIFNVTHFIISKCKQINPQSDRLVTQSHDG